MDAKTKYRRNLNYDLAETKSTHLDLNTLFKQSVSHVLSNHKSKIIFIFDCIKVTVFVYLFLFIHVKVGS